MHLNKLLEKVVKKRNDLSQNLNKTKKLEKNIWDFLEILLNQFNDNIS